MGPPTGLSQITDCAEKEDWAQLLQVQLTMETRCEITYYTSNRDDGDINSTCSKILRLVWGDGFGGVGGWLWEGLVPDAHVCLPPRFPSHRRPDYLLQVSPAGSLPPDSLCHSRFDLSSALPVLS